MAQQRKANKLSDLMRPAEEQTKSSLRLLSSLKDQPEAIRQSLADCIKSRFSRASNDALLTACYEEASSSEEFLKKYNLLFGRNDSATRGKWEPCFMLPGSSKESEEVAFEDLKNQL